MLVFSMIAHGSIFKFGTSDRYYNLYLGILAYLLSLPYQMPPSPMETSLPGYMHAATGMEIFRKPIC
jgi:hypothetical protein